MVSDSWARFVDSLADRGIPLYVVADPLDDLGMPSWAVLAALGLVFMFLVAFVLFPGVKYSLDVTTTPGARVTVSYGNTRLTSVAEAGKVSFSVPLAAQINVKITKNGCEGASMEHVMDDHYGFEKQLEC